MVMLRSALDPLILIKGDTLSVKALGFALNFRQKFGAIKRAIVRSNSLCAPTRLPRQSLPWGAGRMSVIATTATGLNPVDP